MPVTSVTFPWQCLSRLWGAGGCGCKFLPLYTSTLLLDRVSQNRHTKLDYLGELLVRSHRWTRSIEENSLSSPRKCLKSQWIFGRMLFGPTSQNSIFSARMVKLWSGEHHVKNSTQNAQFLRSSTVVIQSWFGAVSPVRVLKNCVY